VRIWRIRRTMAVAATTVVAAGLGTYAVSAVTPSGHGSEPAAAQAWVTQRAQTTIDDTEATLPFTSAPPTTNPIIRVDPKLSFQTYSGVGAAITDSSAHVLYGLTKADRDAVMTNLFAPKAGAGINFLRQPIGASDFAVGADYSFDDVPPGQTDYGLQHFSIAHDETQILPLLRQARALNPRLQIVASPWSMPGWMKDNDSMIDGKLIDTPQIYRAYAGYLVKFLTAYQAAGVPVDYLTVQNEPQALNRKNYPGTDLPFWQEAKVISALGPAIKTAHLHTKILSYDHNWAVHPGDIKSYSQVNEDPQLNYPLSLLETDAAKWISGTAYHCYYGDPSAQTVLRASFPDKDIFMTECEGGDISTAIGVLRNWGKSVIDWNIALDENHGPHLGGCGTCNGTITVNSTTEAVTYNPQYFMLRHFAAFVGGGAVRIASDTADSSGAPVTLQSVAFRNPDRSTALVVWNSSSSKAQTFSVLVHGRSFQATLDPGAIGTYTW
jgi:glucosylceramidase